LCLDKPTTLYGKKFLHNYAYKSLDVDDFIYSNSGHVRRAKALRDLDAYWKRAFDCSVQAEKQNRELMKEKASTEAAMRELRAELDRTIADNSELFAKKNKLEIENRYLRKMLRTYLYPALADEILRNGNEHPQTDTEVTDAAVYDFIECGLPKTFEASVSIDDDMQSEAERLIGRLWGQVDE
jgi:predicted nuclease with TOPRIM domain